MSWRILLRVAADGTRRYDRSVDAVNAPSQGGPRGVLLDSTGEECNKREERFHPPFPTRQAPALLSVGPAEAGGSNTMPDLILSDIVLYLLSGLVLGFLIGLTGIGGGVLTVPFLLLVIKLEPIAAVGTAGLYGVLTKIWAAVRHYRQGTLNVEVGIRFFLASVTGVIVGSVAVKWSRLSLSPSGVETLQDVVSYMVLASICFALVALLFDYDRLDTRFLSSRRGTVVKFPSLFLVGVVMGMTSIGGGILIIPSLLLFYRETSRYVGTSIFVALLLMTVMSTLYAFIGRGQGAADVDLTIAVFMSAGSLGGVHYGATLCKQMSPRRLQAVVVGVIVLAVVMMLVDRFW